jgi:hypothetical protein
LQRLPTAGLHANDPVSIVISRTLFGATELVNLHGVITMMDLQFSEAAACSKLLVGEVKKIISPPINRATDRIQRATDRMQRAIRGAWGRLRKYPSDSYSDKA